MSYYLIDENIDTSLTLPLNCMLWRYPAASICFCLHNHEELELIVMRAGKMRITSDMEKYILSPGDVALFNPFALHQGETPGETMGKTPGETMGMTPGEPPGESDDAGAEYLCLTFNPDKVLRFENSVLSGCASDLTEEKRRFDGFYPAGCDAAIKLSELAEEIFENFKKKTPESECRVLSSLYMSLNELFREHFRPVTADKSYKRNVRFLKNITAFLEERYADDITASDAAAALYISKSYFYRLFYQHFGMGFAKYLCRYRVKRASLQYKDSRLPVSDIAAAAGFSDYCYFSRAFHRYIGQSPAVYFGRRKTGGS